MDPFKKNIFTKKLKIGKIFDIIYSQFKNCKMFFEKIVSVIRIRLGFGLRILFYTSSKGYVNSTEVRGKEVVGITSVRCC